MALDQIQPIIIIIRKHSASYTLKWWEYLVEELGKVAKNRGDELTIIPKE